MELFKKEYDGESLYDLGRDIAEAMMEEYNPLMEEIPVDEHGFANGTFEVSVIWKPEEE